MNIIYKSLNEFPGWDQAPGFLSDLIMRYKSREILEVGSGANPTLALDFIEANQIAYTTSDIDAIELQKADSRLKTLHFDFCDKNLPSHLNHAYDFIFSRMVNEHIQDGKQYYENIYSMLREGGVTCHCFSTLYALPFLVNRLIPESLSTALLRVFAPRDEHSHGKFKAYYSWSRGPSRQMIRRFNEIGFDVIEYAGFFGHEYYQKRLRPLHALEQAKSNFLLSHFQNPHLTAYAYIILQKPKTGASQKSK